MVSFKSLFVVAAATLAVFASPLAGRDTSLIARAAPDVGSTSFIARDLTKSEDSLFTRADAVEASDGSVLGGCDYGGCNTLAEIIVAIHVEIKAQIALIEKAVKSKVDINVLIKLVAQIDVIIKAGTQKIYGCKGPKTLDINVFIDIFISIIITLNAAVKGCAKEHVKVLIQIIIQINITISVFLKTCFGLVAGLDVKFGALIDANVVAAIKALGLVDIIAVIKVHLSVALRAILGA